MGKRRFSALRVVVATLLAGSGLGLIAAMQGANATPSGNIELFAGTNGEGLGTQIGQVVHNVSAADSEIVSSGAARGVVRRLDRATGIQTVIAGHGGIGSLAPSGSNALEMSFGAADIKRHDGLVYFTRGGSIYVLTPHGTLDSVGLTSGADYFTISPAGTFYYSDGVRVWRRESTPSGTTRTVIAGPATGTGVGFNDGPGSGALFGDIRDLALSPDGNTLYVSDLGNFRVRAIDLTSPTFDVSTYAGNGSNALAPSYNGPALDGPFRNVLGLDVLDNGDLLVSTGDDGHVRIVRTDGTMQRWAGSGAVRPPITAPGISATTANFGRVYDVSVAPNGSVAVGADLGLFVVDGGTVIRVAGNYTHGRGGDGLSATDPLTTLLLPRDVAADGQGNVYVSDSMNGAIRKVGTDGVISRFAGPAESLVTGLPGDGGPATNARFSGVGTAVDKQGNVYITDIGNDAVRKIGLDGIITRFAGNGTPGYSGDNGPATAAQVEQPWDLAVDSQGNVFVSELFGTRVRKITPAGIITTFYDDPGTDSPSATRSSTRAIAIGPDDALYIADQTRSQILRIPAAGGAPVAVAGTGTTRPGNSLLVDGGAATATNLYVPSAVAVDHAFNVYFSDECSVRRVDGVTGILTTVSGQGRCNLSGIGGAGRGARHGIPSGITIAGTDLLFSDQSSHRVFRVADVVPPQAPPEADVLSGKIAWHTDEGTPGNNEIVVANPDGTGRIRLTNDPAQDSDPDFADDGHRIAFTSNRSGSFDVWTMRPDGSDLKNITINSTAEADPSFAPINNYIAFTRNPGSGPYDIIRTDENGGNEVNMTASFADSAAYPDWFPDGSSVVAQTQDLVTGEFDLFRFAWDGTPTQLTDTPEDEGEPQVSPDGSKIVYMSDAAGQNDIWIMNADGSNQTRLTTDPGNDFLPTFSPDGNSIVYSDQAHDLIRMRLDGSNKTPVVSDTGVAFAASWVDNFSLVIGSDNDLDAQPSAVQGASVLMQEKAPDIQSAPLKLSLLDISGSPLKLSLLDIVGSPLKLSLLDIVGSPLKLSLLDIVGSPLKLSLLDIVGSPLKLSLLDIAGSPGLRDALDQISLMSIPIEGGWESYFPPGTPIQGKSLLDAINTGERVPFLAPDLSQSPFAQVSLVSYFLGQTSLRDIADAATEAKWCTVLESLDADYVGTNDPDDCGAPRFATPNRPGGSLSATFMELQLQGLPLSLFPEIVEVNVGDVNWDFDGASGNAIDTPFEAVRLPFVDLGSSDLGALTMGQLAAAGVRDKIVDCSAATGVCADDETLAVAQNQGALKADAVLQYLLPVIGEYNLMLSVIGVIPTSIRPLQALDPESPLVSSVDEPGAQDALYLTQFSPVGVAVAHEPTVTLTLPEGFAVRSAFANILTDGVYGPQLTMKLKSVKGRVVTLRAEGVDVPAGSVLNVHTFALPGQLLSSSRRASARITAPGVDQSLTNRAGVSVEERFEPVNDDPETAPSMVPDTMYITHVAEPGDVDYWTVPLQAGDRIRILLKQPKPDVVGGDADLDLVAYAPSGATTAPLRATTAGGEAVVPVFDKANRLGEPVLPDVIQEVNLLDRPVVALSSNRGGFNESISVLAPVTGDYLLQVAGFNGASSSRPYSLQGTVEIGRPIPSCPETPRTVVAPAAGQQGTLSAVPAGTETLVLLNRSRLYGLYDDAEVDALIGRVNDFAANSTVHGAVLNVDGASAVRDAYTAADADPCNVELANDVVRQINATVDGLTNLRNGTLKHLVVIGNDDVIPMARIPDLTQASNERTYADALRAAGGSVATLSAFEAGNVLSDDPYGDGNPAPYLGRHLYVSDLGLGRLVEAPLDIAAQLKSYTDTFADASSTNDGRLDTSTALTAGYDFMSDVATEIDGQLDALTGASATADNQLIGNGWSDSDLRSRFTAASPSKDITSLNAHFAHDLLETPSTGRVTVGELDGGPFDGERGLVFSMGCHSGLNVPDVVVGPAQPGTRDWAQALSAKKTTFVGQTGFGYGLKDAIALSEDIMLGFTKNLRTTLTVGQALSTAKQDYLGGLGVYGVYDEKALAQATLYGLPNWKAGTAPVPAPPSPRPLSTDARTGLDAASFDNTESFSQRSTDDGTYWNGSGGTLVVHDRPIQPKSEIDVTQPNGLVAHGTEITGLTSDEVSVNPVFARVVLDDSTRETEVEDPTTVFPAALQRVNGYSTSQGERQRLVLMTGQYRSSGVDDAGNVTGAQRFYRRMAGKVLYSASTDFTTPDILSSKLDKVGDALAFEVNADDALGAATVRSVSVLYHAVGVGDAGSDVWTRLELQRDPDDATKWLAIGGAPIDGDGDEIEFLVVVGDSSGNFAYADRKGAFFEAAAPPPPPAGVTTTIVGQPSASGWYDSAEVVLASESGDTFEYAVDGGPWQPYDGPIPVTEEGTHTVAYRTGNGDTGEVVVPIDTSAPSITIASPQNGQSFVQGTVVNADYDCADTGSGIAGCVGTVASGTAIDTASPGTKTFSVTATDRAGHSTTSAVTYTVTAPPPAGYRFEGFTAPVANPPALNNANSGQTIPVKWKLFDAQNRPVTDLNAITKIRSFAISCSTKERTGLFDDTYSKSDVKIDAGQYSFNWKTSKLWAGSCRRLEFTFSGGLVRYADFKFAK